MAVLNRICALFMSIIMGLFSFFGISLPETEVSTESWNTNYTYVFVHGLMGWGSYDVANYLMPYWGMFGGDLMSFLNNSGFDCKAASVAPTSSAWDRACELYAQLTGTVTDYGKAHSEKYGHDRYGEDFTGRALVDKWSATDKINILGHSFGGATVRTLAHLMANGDAEEIAATPANELSPLFSGGKADWIYSLTSLAAPHNGTSSYGTSCAAQPDTAAYDMFIDNALALNNKLKISDSTYYFSFTCSMTEENDDGTHSPIKSKMEFIYSGSSEELGKLTGVTDGGFVIDESWLENDGLVNTVSAAYPFGAPHTDYAEGQVRKGIWNVMPKYHGDHMSLQGGMTVTNNVKPLYIAHLSMINSL